jgi:hypothetical protein
MAASIGLTVDVDGDESKSLASCMAAMVSFLGENGQDQQPAKY